MKTLIALALIVAAAPLAFAQSKTYEIRKDAKNVAEFHAEDTYDSFDGKTNDVSGAIVADPSKPAASTVQLSVNMASLETGVGLRDKEMREKYLETPKFATATFKSVSVSGPASVGNNAPADISVTGDMTLHGVTKRMTIPVRVVLIPDGRIHVTTRFAIKMPDFGINVPHNVLVTVNDEVPVRLDLWGTTK